MWVILFTLCASSLSAYCDEILAPKDLAFMQGEWEPIFVEGIITEHRPRFFSSRLVVKGDVFIFIEVLPDGSRKELPTPVRLYPTMSPKGIDFIDPMPKGPGLPRGPVVIGRGIYEVTRHIFVIKQGMERPVDFSAPFDLRSPIVVLRRVK